MARVTVEDCINKVRDKFELVLLAAQRARDINSGIALTLDRDNDKDAVLALREIASNTMKINLLKEQLINRLRNNHKIDFLQEENTHIDENVDLENFNSGNEEDYIKKDEELEFENNDSLTFSNEDIIEEDITID